MCRLEKHPKGSIHDDLESSYYKDCCQVSIIITKQEVYSVRWKPKIALTPLSLQVALLTPLTTCRYCRCGFACYNCFTLYDMK